MDHYRLKRCLKLHDWSLSGHLNKRRSQAKALGTSRRTVTRDRRLIQDALAAVRPATAVRQASRQGGQAGDRRQGTVGTDRHPDLHHLARCTEILEMEHAGQRTTIQGLAETFEMEKRTIFRDLELIEEAIGRRLTLVQRRAKKKN